MCVCVYVDKYLYLYLIYITFFSVAQSYTEWLSVVCSLNFLWLANVSLATASLP